MNLSLGAIDDAIVVIVGIVAGLLNLEPKPVGDHAHACK